MPEVYYPVAPAQTRQALLNVRLRGIATAEFSSRLREIVTNVDRTLRLAPVRTLADRNRQELLIARLVGWIVGLIRRECAAALGRRYLRDDVVHRHAAAEGNRHPFRSRRAPEAGVEEHLCALGSADRGRRVSGACGGNAPGAAHGRRAAGRPRPHSASGFRLRDGYRRVARDAWPRAAWSQGSAHGSAKGRLTTLGPWPSFVLNPDVTKNQAARASASAMRVKVRRVSRLSVRRSRSVPPGRTSWAAR